MCVLYSSHTPNDRQSGLPICVYYFRAQEDSLKNTFAWGILSSEANILCGKYAHTHPLKMKQIDVICKKSEEIEHSFNWK